MEEYTFAGENKNHQPIKLGRFFSIVNQKHVTSYGESGAKTIVDNVIETYNFLQDQFNSNELNNNALLVGKVQSGKTSNLELLTAIAFDNGYNFLIIYGGYDKSLLGQTAKRFIKTFDGDDEVTLETDSPAIYTTLNSLDLESLDQSMVDELFSCDKPIIVVSMKRPPAMKKVNALLKKLDTNKLKPFIIDDEGDQASLNTAKDKIQNASATYKQITIMKKCLNDPLYLSVTATPEANIFLDDWSQLRPDSIRLIKPGKGYQGAEAYHVEENGIIECVTDSDRELLDDGTIPTSLWEAVRCFIIMSAIKHSRATKIKDSYSDMIIHSFREVNQHDNIYVSVLNYIKDMSDCFEYGGEDIHIKELKKTYDKYLSQKLKDEYHFNDLVENIISVAKKTSVILKNGKGKSTQGNIGLKTHKIYIGGDLLQRGLTFDNLIVTYFTRWASKSGGNMDTNLQRARWFGYREKYIDLCKIFTTGEIASEFAKLAEIEDDLWEQFEDVENGIIKVDDVIVKADGTNQNPTGKGRVSYKRVKFKNRWIKQRVIVSDKNTVKNNNSLILSIIKANNWSYTSAGNKSPVRHTGYYSVVSSEQMRNLINLVENAFDYEPFQKKALSDLVGSESIPVVLMWDEELLKPTIRYRSLYSNTNKIKALQQGANSKDPEKVTYSGDSFVIADKDKVNIQIHYVSPGISAEDCDKELTQFMFAVYVPKEKTYFVKDE